jgi:hypothetical protein
MVPPSSGWAVATGARCDGETEIEMIHYQKSAA